MRFSTEPTKTVFYMPSYYLALATSYKLFGFGAFQSLLPSLVSFVLAAVCTCLIARRFYGRTAGWLAAILFIAFPPNLFFACVAMSEMAVTASAVIALCVFIYLPPRARLYVGPLSSSLLFCSEIPMHYSSSR